MESRGKPARVLGIDPSLSLGWAVLDGGSLAAHGLIRLDLITGRGARGRRVLECLSQMRLLLEEHRPARLAYEQVPLHRSFRSADACLAYASVVACLEAAAAQTGVPVVPVAAASLKKLATGDGRAKKQGPGGVREAANEWWGDLGSDDIADALWVALAAAGPSGDARNVSDLLDT